VAVAPVGACGKMEKQQECRSHCSTPCHVVLFWHRGNVLPFLTDVTSSVSGGEGRELVSVLLFGPTGYTSTTDSVSAPDNGKKTSHAASPHRLSPAGLQEISH
jgi:hypothetical protein